MMNEIINLLTLERMKLALRSKLSFISLIQQINFRFIEQKQERNAQTIEIYSK
jgi:hypothetical protein